jgi:hypothetical protein
MLLQGTDAQWKTASQSRRWDDDASALEPDCLFQPGDLVELEEGIFVLNEELNPMELATVEQIKQAQEDSDS